MSAPSSNIRWLWTCRQGFEDDLREELARAGRLDPRVVAPAVVDSRGRPAGWPVFARAGFPVAAENGADAGAVAGALAGALAPPGKRPRPWALLAWVPDTDATNLLAADATFLGEKTAAAIEAARRDVGLARVEASEDAVRYGGLLAQVCLLSRDSVACGVLPAADAPTTAPGGRDRSRMPKDAPSRAGRKLVEALEWMGRGPEPGEQCVDLGAAPGGWSAVLLERRARVIAVDPANLAPHLARQRGLTHVKASAFEFAPPEPVDWLLCDMAWRPLEVAALLAKWARRRWANALVANVKLPMKQRVEFVGRVRTAVEAGGWRDVRARHLYHDREEVTLTAWRT